MPSPSHTGSTTTASGSRIEATPDIAGDVGRLVTRMVAEALTARRDPLDDQMVLLSRSGPKGSLGAGRVPIALVEAAVDAGLLAEVGRGRWQATASILTPPESVRHSVSSDLPVHGHQLSSAIPAPPRLNDAESPLRWLYVRKGRDGAGLLTEREYLAGERFRLDVTQAAMLPSVTTNWSRLAIAEGRSAPRDPALASDVVIAARQRVRSAYRRLGGELGDFTLDICGFLAPLQEAEARRGWPSRAGKLALKLALGQLADHYGVTVEAIGPSRAPTAVWRADGAAADMANWLMD